MSDKHVVAALQRSVADLELRLIEVVRERDQAYDDRNRARAERDLVRSAWAGAEDSLVAEREHAEQLRRERDEAREGIATLRELTREWAHDTDQSRQALEKAEQERDEAQAEVERLRAELEGEWLTRSKRLEEDGAKLLAGFAASSHARLRAVAERQREACAAEASGVACYGHGMDADEVWMREACVDAVLATPLVTEEDK